MPPSINNTCFISSPRAINRLINKPQVKTKTAIFHRKPLKDVPKNQFHQTQTIHCDLLVKRDLLSISFD